MQNCKKKEDEKIARARGLIAVSLIMSAMVLGAFAVQYYTWTAQTQVNPLTYTLALSPLVTKSGATQIFDNWGTRATSSTAATPATDGTNNATITLQKTSKIHFKIADADATNLNSAYSDLKVTIAAYRTGDNTEIWAGENIYLYVITDDTANTNIENATSALTTVDTYDCVIEISGNTDNVTANTTADIPIKIYAVEE